MSPKDWVPEIRETDLPRYVGIAEAIGADIASGRLKPGDRLPPQRQIAEVMGADISAISRGYAEAARRGYVQAHVGRGTFVLDPRAGEPSADPQRTNEEDPRMNMPPEPEDPKLIAKMQAGLSHVAANIVPLLRYQSPLGGDKDKEIAGKWLKANELSFVPERFAVAPGGHAAIDAALAVLRQPDTVVLCEQVTYPGIRAITARLGLPLVEVEEDEHGVTPAALDVAINRHPQAVLYLNPTLRNPTTHTIPARRRSEISRVLRAHSTPLIEDDAYRFVATDAPAPISDSLPDLGWHIAGISKVFGAGLRLAYVQVPNASFLDSFVKAVRAAHVMTSPISLALLSTWIEDGTAAQVQAFVRRAARERQQIASETLIGMTFDGDPDAFNIWLTLPDGLNRAEALARLFGRQIGILPSDFFIPTGAGQEKLRICLGGPIPLDSLRKELQHVHHALSARDWSG